MSLIKNLQQQQDTNKFRKLEKMGEDYSKVLVEKPQNANLRYGKRNNWSRKRSNF